MEGSLSLSCCPKKQTQWVWKEKLKADPKTVSVPLLFDVVCQSKEKCVEQGKMWNQHADWNSKWPSCNLSWQCCFVVMRSQSWHQQGWCQLRQMRKSNFRLNHLTGRCWFETTRKRIVEKQWSHVAWFSAAVGPTNSDNQKARQLCQVAWCFPSLLMEHCFQTISVLQLWLWKTVQLQCATVTFCGCAQASNQNDPKNAKCRSKNYLSTWDDFQGGLKFSTSKHDNPSPDILQRHCCHQGSHFGRQGAVN